MSICLPLLCPYVCVQPCVCVFVLVDVCVCVCACVCVCVRVHFSAVMGHHCHCRGSGPPDPHLLLLHHQEMLLQEEEEQEGEEREGGDGHDQHEGRRGMSNPGGVIMAGYWKPLPDCFGYLKAHFSALNAASTI